MTGNHQGNTLAADKLLTSGEVAAMWQVDPKTIRQWANRGWGNPIVTPGGHRRFPESAVRLPAKGQQS